MVHKVFIGVLDKNPNKIRIVCEDIKKRDPRFQYYLTKPVNKLRIKFTAILVLLSDDKKDVERRAGWFIHKCTDAKLSKYFWK